ncbi:MAG: hypothetical protein GEU99_17550 [Luteitalea sp.]|nr:hypothetical protein [Luteitalea sp.]
MASEHDRSVVIEPLPAHPCLEMQQKRPKNLLRAAAHGEADALQRIRALHPKPPPPDALKLADTQLVVARGYGFESWAAMRRKIDSLTKTPLDQFRSALRAGDAEQVRALLEAHAEVRAAVNQPVGGWRLRFRGDGAAAAGGGRACGPDGSADRSRRSGCRLARTSLGAPSRVPQTIGWYNQFVAQGICSAMGLWLTDASSIVSRNAIAWSRPGSRRREVSPSSSWRGRVSGPATLSRSPKSVYCGC